MKTAPILLDRPAGPGVLVRAGSARLTLVLLPLLGLAVVAVGQDGGPPSWTLAAPLALLAINLAAAIVGRGAFRAQPALLAYHLALLLLVLLAGAGRLTYLKGTLELSVGEAFGGSLTSEDSGPLHRRQLDRAGFVNRGFTVDYESGLKRARTRNQVAIAGPGGAQIGVEIGDDEPLKLAGYRFYTTSNKGFAPEFVWMPASGGEAVRGTVHLPSFPAQLAHQESEWTPPGSRTQVLVRLDLTEKIVDLETRWTLGSPPAHVLTLAIQGSEHELRPGESLQLDVGTLRYLGLRLWMGYSVFHDWTVPWMLSAAVFAACALAAVYVGRFRRRAWHAGAGGAATP